MRPPLRCLTPGGHLLGRGLAGGAAAGRGGGLVGLPGLAGDVGVGVDGSLGGGHESVGLQAHLGGELAGAFGLALEPGDPGAVLVAASFWDAMVRSRAVVTLLW